jgi:hypothetical protein
VKKARAAFLLAFLVSLGSSSLIAELVADHHLSWQVWAGLILASGIAATVQGIHAYWRQLSGPPELAGIRIQEVKKP